MLIISARLLAFQSKRKVFLGGLYIKIRGIFFPKVLRKIINKSILIVQERN